MPLENRRMVFLPKWLRIQHLWTFQKWGVVEIPIFSSAFLCAAEQSREKSRRRCGEILILHWNFLYQSIFTLDPIRFNGYPSRHVRSDMFVLFTLSLFP